jgi:hypothetical protein
VSATARPAAATKTWLTDLNHPSRSRELEGGRSAKWNKEQPMKNTKFIVKVHRGGAYAPEYVERMDRAPIQMTTNRKLALMMGGFTAEDAVKSLQTSQCAPELVSVRVSA